MLKYRFVFVSKDDSFRLDRPLTDKFAEENPTCRFDYVPGNKMPLASVYNLFLGEACTAEFDYIVLMHADVRLDLKGFIEHVESVHGKYDLMGLVGCSKFSVSQSPLNWFCGSKPFPNDRWGCVSHGELGNQTSFFSQRYPDVTDREVACIDGLCIVFSQKAVKTGLRFDESLGGFDFYDTDISYAAVVKYGLKVGVLVRRDLMHFSIGKSILSESFLDTEVKFRAKWGLPIPPASALAARLAKAKGPLALNPGNAN